MRGQDSLTIIVFLLLFGLHQNVSIYHICVSKSIFSGCFFFLSFLSLFVTSALRLAERVDRLQ